MALNMTTTNQREMHSNLTGKSEHSNLDEKQQYQQPRNLISVSFDLDQIDEQYMRETREIYSKQCPSLVTNNSKQQQESMFKLLSIGRINNCPLMFNLIDCYLRDKFNNFIQNPAKTTKITEWCSNCQIINTLTCKMNEHKSQIIKEIITSSMETYFKRYCSPIMLPTSYKIRDSITSFIHCLHQIGKLIKNTRPNKMFPFQIDLVILPRDVIDTANEYASDPETDFDDDFDDDSSDNSSDDEPTATPSKWTAEIDNIASKLRNNNLSYEFASKTIVETDFVDLYKTHSESTRKKESNLGENNKYRFPHKKRLCIIVDRRLPPNDANDQKNEDEKNNDIYLFEPPVFNDMPDNYVREWFIESSYQCIIPGHNNNNVTSKDSLGGWINVFSFHIEQEDEIRCYFYRGGQMLRFMASDIKDLFIHLFDLKSFKNDMYVNGQGIENDMERMKNLLKDIQFNKFKEIFS